MKVSELRVVLTVADFSQAVGLFREGLGMAQVAEWQNDGGHAVLLDAGRATLEIFDEAQAAAIDHIEVGRRVSGQVRLALGVPESDSAMADLKAVGADVIGGPLTTPWGDRNVRLVGPEGIQLTLFSPPGTT